MLDGVSLLSLSSLVEPNLIFCWGFFDLLSCLSKGLCFVLWGSWASLGWDECCARLNSFLKRSQASPLSSIGRAEPNSTFRGI